MAELGRPAGQGSPVVGKLVAVDKPVVEGILVEDIPTHNTT